MNLSRRGRGRGSHLAGLRLLPGRRQLPLCLRNGALSLLEKPLSFCHVLSGLFRLLARVLEFGLLGWDCRVCAFDRNKLGWPSRIA